MIATFRTLRFGTSIRSSPLDMTVCSRPSELTVPSMSPARSPPCRRTRSPTTNGRALSSTTPAKRLPSVCCAARPTITAVAAAAGTRSWLRHAADAQRDEDRDDREEEPQEEADGAGGRGVHPAEERGREDPAEVAREAEADEQQRDGGAAARIGASMPNSSSRKMKSTTVAAASSARTKNSIRARLTARTLSWRASPTSRHAWLRVSNIFSLVRRALPACRGPARASR